MKLIYPVLLLAFSVTAPARAATYDEAQKQTLKQVKAMLDEIGSGRTGEAYKFVSDLKEKERSKLDEVRKDPAMVRLEKKYPYLAKLLKHRDEELRYLALERMDQTMAQLMMRKLKAAGLRVTGSFDDAGGDPEGYFYKEEGGPNPDAGAIPALTHYGDTTISAYVNVCQGDGSGCIQVQSRDEGSTSYFMIRTDL